MGEKAGKICAEKYGITEDKVKENAKADKLSENDYCFTGCMMLEEGAVISLYFFFRTQNWI